MIFRARLTVIHIENLLIWRSKFYSTFYVVALINEICVASVLSLFSPPPNKMDHLFLQLGEFITLCVYTFWYYKQSQFKISIFQKLYIEIWGNTSRNIIEKLLKTLFVVLSPKIVILNCKKKYFSIYLSLQTVLKTVWYLALYRM